MKKGLIIIFILLYAFLGVFVVNKFDVAVPTNTSSEQYAKIIEQNCHLFKTPTKNYHYSNVMFMLEKSYFVIVINEEKDFYYVCYDNLKGYILKSTAELINEVPKSAFLTNITLNISNSCFMYSSPEVSENSKLKELPKNTTLNYIGKINGSTENLHGTNLWYYCKITENDNDLYGYVCSDNTNNLSSINENTEITTTKISKTSENNFLYLNTTTSNLIILLISLPTILVVFLLIKGFKN